MMFNIRDLSVMHEMHAGADFCARCDHGGFLSRRTCAASQGFFLHDEKFFQVCPAPEPACVAITGGKLHVEKPFA